jgi:alkylated DNA nucleotide flippase Atl1
MWAIMPDSHSNAQPAIRYPQPIELALLQLVSDARSALVRFEARLQAEFGVESAVDSPVLRGKRQSEIAQLPALFGEDGVTATQVSREVHYDEPNTYSVLSSLEKAGLLETVPRSTPQRWRLAETYRHNPTLLAARQIHAGEWATYGDVSVAATGSTSSAIGVGRMAATLPIFPTPYRVLSAEGWIHENWHGFGGGRETCRQMLLSEGVQVSDKWQAAPERHVSFETLQLRMRDALAL